MCKKVRSFLNLSKIGASKEQKQDNRPIRITNNRITNKNNNIMKKIILTVVAAMAITLGYAKTQNTTAVKNVENHSITFDLRRLAVTLDLDFDQMEAVKIISDNMNEELTSAATARRFERPALVRKAIDKDVRNMRNVLNDKQYETYMKLLRATLQNRFRR